MVSVNNVSVLFGSFVLLDEVSFLITRQERIGLTGRNGAGKSTLMKIIAGMQDPTSGSVERPRELTVGYLEQQMTVSDTTTVMEETLTAFAEIRALEQEIADVTGEIAERTDYESESYHNLCDRLHSAGERHQLLGGNDYTALARQTLAGLGFGPEEFNRPTRELSGGWRMRVELAKILLRKPDLILLDEPTNHLDIESIIWLEGFLETYPGAVILVSHDRTFLDNVTRRTVEISLGKIYDYRVPYTQYTVLRRERREQQTAAYRNQKKMIEDTEKFIERFRYKPTKAVQVQSKIKQLKKLDRIEIEDEDTSAMNIRFSPAPRSGTVVVEADETSKRYGDHLVLDRISLKIERGEKVAFVGRNGEGKTTLARMILGQIDHEGTVKRGHNVSIGYFAQNQDELLNDELTVFDTVDRIARGDIRTRLRDILGAFLFHGDDIDKKVKVLSGGERSRLAIVQLLLEPYNLLLLDEPTNHLDIRSKEILKQALIKFDGTLIVVSHDRDFLDGLVNKVYEFRNRKIRTHLGGIAEFLRSRKIESLRELEMRYAPGGKKSRAATGAAGRGAGAQGSKPGAAGSSASAAGGRRGAADSKAGAPGSKPGAAGGGANAAGGRRGAADSKAGAPGSKPGAAGSSASAAGNRKTKASPLPNGNTAGSRAGGNMAARPESSQENEAVPGTAASSLLSSPQSSKMLYLEKKETGRVYRRLLRETEKREEEISTLEKEIAAMNARIAAGDSSAVNDPAFFSLYEERKEKLDALMQRWEHAHSELENFKTEYMNDDDNI
jgi:ATP-binding cassette subfamily F protein 3